MELSLALLCDDALARPDGRFDVVGVFNELSAPGFPAMQARMTLVLVMTWSPDEAGTQAFRADLLLEDGKKALTVEGETEVAAHVAGRSAAQTRLVLPLEDVVFPSPGLYRFELVAGGDVHRACSLYLTEQPET
jgi:hypothetical protein